MMVSLFFPFCGPAVSELFFSLPDTHGYKSRSDVCFTSDMLVGKKKVNLQLKMLLMSELMFWNSRELRESVLKVG